MYGGLQSCVCGSWFHNLFDKQFKGFSCDHHMYVGYGFFDFFCYLIFNFFLVPFDHICGSQLHIEFFSLICFFYKGFLTFGCVYVVMVTC